MATVSLEKVSKVYPNGLLAVSDLDLDVAEGELMVLVGPSGSGKTTALRMVAGLEDITSGALRMDGRVVNDLSPKDRNVAMIFQSYALYPHMSVAGNIGFSLKLRKVPKGEIKSKVREAADLLGLTEYLDRKPGQLSGGQRQRVAMGRAIVREPSVFLMDEPLSNLDAKMRVQMRAEILRIQRRVGVAALYVTHDQTEAMTLGDRVAVLHKGRLQQCSTPQVLYSRPDNVFVAAFIGSPAMNLYEGLLSPGGDEVKLGPQSLALPHELRLARPALRAYGGHRVIVGIRPEHLVDATLGSVPVPGTTLVADVELVEALGNELQVHFLVEGTSAQSEDTEAARGTSELGGVGALHAGGARTEGVARTSPRSALRGGSRATFVVDTEHLHFFDAGTGLAIWGQASSASSGPASRT
jgi:multiple sugar transport system ATP-binding protein